MKIATILPTKYLYLEEDNEYHLCLAHQLKKDSKYAKFFKDQATKGHFIIQDNGVVECGVPLPIQELREIAERIGCSEVVMPDSIFNYWETINLSQYAVAYMRLAMPQMKLFVVPQGSGPLEWMECVHQMLKWEIDTIGISRFVVPKLFSSRLEALKSVPMLIESDKNIHLLGCPEWPEEIAEIEAAFPGRVRGVDSGIAAIYAQDGIIMRKDAKKPERIIDLDNRDINESILERNIREWKLRAS